MAGTGFSFSQEGVVTRVDRTKGCGWIKVDGMGRKEFYFSATNLERPLCISKIKKGVGVFFTPVENRATRIRPISVAVVDNWGDED